MKCPGCSGNPSHGCDYPDCQPEWRSCDDPAVDRVTGERFYCCLRSGHAGSHLWQQEKGHQVLRSCSWFKTGSVTFVGREMP